MKDIAMRSPKHTIKKLLSAKIRVRENYNGILFVGDGYAMIRVPHEYEGYAMEYEPREVSILEKTFLVEPLLDYGRTAYPAEIVRMESLLTWQQTDVVAMRDHDNDDLLAYYDLSYLNMIRYDDWASCQFIIDRSHKFRPLTILKRNLHGVWDVVGFVMDMDISYSNSDTVSKSSKLDKSGKIVPYIEKEVQYV